jgi:3-hydroxy-9,10-secoandrosta-1,3,5(10)-triene-9,17-dione monooxygenase
MTPDELVASATAMIPLLRQLQTDAANRGTYGPEVHRAFVEAGFYRVLQPRRYGGLEFDVPTFLQVIIEISRGDPGVGWCLALASGRMIAFCSHFPERAQREAFQHTGEFRCPYRGIPQGTAVPVEGGYVINGVWDFCSGAPYSTHFMGQAVVTQGTPDSTIPPERIVFVIPHTDYEILSDWGAGSIIGMQASGSNSVAIDHRFVPTYFTVADWRESEHPKGTTGTRLHGNPMYLGRTDAFHPAEIVSTVVGAARAALDEYEEVLRTRTSMTASAVPRYRDPDQQAALGKGLFLVDSAEAVLLEAGNRYMKLGRRWADSRTTYSIRDDFRLYGMVATAGRLAAEAVQLLFDAAGASATRPDGRLQRYLRDVAVYRTHPVAQYEPRARIAGAAYLGGPVGRTPLSD